MPHFSESDTAEGEQGHILAHPPRVLPTEYTETLDETGVGNDLPVAVILVPPSWYYHTASTSTTSSYAKHIYDLGYGRGLCGRRCQRRTSSCTDSQKILEGYQECTACVPAVVKFIN